MDPQAFLAANSLRASSLPAAPGGVPLSSSRPSSLASSTNSIRTQDGVAAPSTGAASLRSSFGGGGPPPPPPPAPGPPPAALVKERVDLEYTRMMNERARAAKSRLASSSGGGGRLPKSPVIKRAGTGQPKLTEAGGGGGSGGVDEETQERMLLVRKLNKYREAYADQIDFTFKSMYHPGMDLEFLRIELVTVQALVNGRGSGDAIKALFAGLGRGLYEAHVIMNPKLVTGRQDFLKVFERATDGGAFDDELQQLDIEYGHWLTAPPLMRLANKVGKIYLEVAAANTIGGPPPGAGGPPPKANDKHPNL